MSSRHSVAKRTAVLVDQHPLWLDAVEQLVARVGVEVVLKSTSSDEVLERLGELQPHLLVTGLDMPVGEMSGIKLIGSARECVPRLKVLVISANDDAAHIDGAFAAGAHSYALKTAHPDDLVAAVRQACSQSIFLASRGGVIEPASRRQVPPAAGGQGLTRRELEILQLLAEGHSNAQLARMLWVTEQTVKFHLSNIYRKLGVANRTEASRWAQVQGVLNGSLLRTA
jgi:two-component system, NarL family, response regulator DegU